MPQKVPTESEVSHPDDVMFSPSVRAEQTCRGSREANAGGFRQNLSAEATAFIAQRDSAYIATASADGQPYVQHRGGPRGFLKVLDERTIAFVEYPGNRQYISTGHLAENDKSFLFLMDYEHARRLKLWGRAKITDDQVLLARVTDANSHAPAQHAIIFSVLAWDWNCSKHIPRLAPTVPT
jgi:predicted pyridoxine 5'-phosphate oxidase superfamily flavin-nucleotide-binding protein